MLSPGTGDGLQGHTRVEGDEAPAVLDSQRQQVGVGDLPMPQYLRPGQGLFQNRSARGSGLVFCATGRARSSGLAQNTRPLGSRAPASGLWGKSLTSGILTARRPTGGFAGGGRVAIQPRLAPDIGLKRGFSGAICTGEESFGSAMSVKPLTSTPFTGCHDCSM